VMGNLKFDSTGGRLAPEEAARWRDELGVPAEAPVLVAGSTAPEDEGPLLDAIATLRGEGLDLRAVIAPRRKERVAAVLEGCRARDLAAGLRTRGDRSPVLVLDTMGELARTYNLARVAYVGGGLTPDVGLHNLIEPVVCGAPLVFGHHHGKARRVAAEFLRLGAGLEVSDAPTLLAALRAALTDPAARERLAAAASRLLALNQGAAARQAERIRALAPGAGAA